MVKHVQILFAVMAGHLVGGCLLIPYGYTCESERVVAERKDDTGKVREQIVHRKMHLDIAVIGPNPEGGLSNSTYFLYSRFAHVADGKRSGIWAYARRVSRICTGSLNVFPGRADSGKVCMIKKRERDAAGKRN